jgi:hypothetical protein
MNNNILTMDKIKKSQSEVEKKKSKKKCFLAVLENKELKQQPAEIRSSFFLNISNS